ncbi:DNA primase [Metamycoplasma equirhinis]|uniref:DNA primase n=1 Tax=Metamycoplasma equirhinis TaxID=92402 RepID=UPI0035934EC8
MEQDNIWDIVISKTDIIDVIGEHVALSKKGKNFVACCPFHSERTPSFVVSPDKGIFTCFGCGKSGNSLKFIEYYKNISPIEALKELAKKNNIDISKYINIQNFNEHTLEQEKILGINKDALDFFQYEMLICKEKKLLDFLNKRFLSRELIKEFEIGYANESKSIYNYLIEKKHEIFEIANSSLVSSNGEKNFFNNRLIFPLKDGYGNIVGFSGRDITSQNDPKYLNSSDTIVFKKQEIMFNYFHAKNEIIRQNEVYLVEGQFDVIAMYKVGIKNAIAIMGTSLSISHLQNLKGCKINLFFDNDSAGKKATRKNLHAILQHTAELKLIPYFVLNTLSKDADEIFNIDDGKTLKSIVENKVDLLTYLLKEFEIIWRNDNIFEVDKLKKYKELFAFVYYLDPQLRYVLKNRLLEAKIFSIESYSNFEKYIKPISERHTNFARRNKKQNQNQNNQDYNYFDNFDFEIENLEQANNKKNEDHKKNLLVFGKNRCLITIIKTILSEPLYVKEIEPILFARMHINNDKKNLRRHELICYVTSLINKGNQYNELENLDVLIKNDKKIDNQKKSDLLIALDEVKNLEDPIYEKNEFINQINNFINDDEVPKKLIKMKVTQ